MKKFMGRFMFDDVWLDDVEDKVVIDLIEYLQRQVRHDYIKYRDLDFKPPTYTGVAGLNKQKILNTLSTDLDNERFVVDMRKRETQAREVRDGGAMLMQYRHNILEIDGSITYGEWETSNTIPNYGDCLDKKPSLFERIIKVFT